MKASERRLLMIFMLVAAIIGGFMIAGVLNAWQSRLSRREWQAEQEQTQAATLMAEAPQWTARGAWLAQAQPVATSELEANQGLLDALENSASDMGLEITKKQIEPVEKKQFFRQFGVTLTVKGPVPALMRWIHGTQVPDAFYVVPRLRISPDKDDPAKVNAQVTFWRWYGAEIAAAPPVDGSQKPEADGQNPAVETSNPGS